ncbi:nitroreductase family protein [Spirochaeta cellobiosiphila]|uniref:nitroreductase family protein n=1 Tax=Spirochaeta cellobiosiphila TaxID=504483 RepID=UPI0003FAA548|nr:nitroreductase family protein [Spirochaeta cellobiosiphila]
MSFITIDSENCTHCGACVKDCPVGIIRQDKGQLPYGVEADKDSCILCGHCVAICSKGSFEHSMLAPDEFKPVYDLPLDSKSIGHFLSSRRSVRIFKKSPVPKEQIEQLLEVARRAPTASNSQQVSWNIIADADRLERIRTLTLDWISKARRLSIYTKMEEQGRDVVLRGGPNLVVAYSPEEYTWAQGDCAIALTYMELHASSMDLGACWAGLVTSASKSDPKLRDVLGVPEGYIVGGALILGPTNQKYYKIPPRKVGTVSWL